MSKKDKSNMNKEHAVVTSEVKLPQETEESLVALSNLESGWTENGKSITPSSIRKARDILSDSLIGFDATKRGYPGVYPTPEGGVQLEWALDESMYSILAINHDTGFTFSQVFVPDTKNSRYDTTESMDELKALLKNRLV